MTKPKMKIRALSNIAVFTLASGYDNGLGRLPPMGWNSWCTSEGAFQPSVCNLVGKDPCSDKQVRSVANAIVDEGMDKLGYKYLVLDDCWSEATRNATGHLQAYPDKFPTGISGLADYVHSKGLMLGVYTSYGTKTCKGGRPGSFGYYDKDANTLASWGVDFVKMDHCGGHNGTDQELYGQMSKSLNATGRPILFSLCQWGDANVSFGYAHSNTHQHNQHLQRSNKQRCNATDAKDLEKSKNYFPAYPFDIG